MDLLADYGSDSESSELNDQGRLELPNDVHNLYQSSLYDPSNVSKMVDELTGPNPNGFIRSKPHERGRWPSHVFIYVPETNELKELINMAIDDFCTQLDSKSFTNQVTKDRLTANEGYHLSLSRPFFLRTHQVEPFSDRIRNNLAGIFKFRCEIARTYDILVNDDKTRSFLCLKVVSNLKSLHSLIDRVNESLSEFQQPVYYENPNLHMSIASVAGDISTLFNAYGSNHDTEDVEIVDIDVNSVTVKAGHHSFIYDLT